MAKQKTKITPAPRKASAKKPATAKKAPALDLTPVETIRIPPEDAPSLEALRLFVKAYEKL
jgi:hypothetical protein